MTALGYVTGRNLTIDEGWGGDSREETARLAAELAARKPEVIVTQGPALFAARNVGGTTPVVFGFSGDPVMAKVAQSFARPGSRFTGMSFLALDLVGKRVDLLQEVFPKARRLAAIGSPDHPGDTKELAATQEAAARHGMEVSYYPLRSAVEIDSVLAGVAAARAEAAVIHPNAGMLRLRTTFAKFSVQQRIPTISGWAEFAEGGNLFSYGPVLEDGFRRLAYFVDRILKGANPAELPVELPRTVELVINLRAAKALGLALPRTLIERADRLIE